MKYQLPQTLHPDLTTVDALMNVLLDSSLYLRTQIDTCIDKSAQIQVLFYSLYFSTKQYMSWAPFYVNKYISASILMSLLLFSEKVKEKGTREI